MIDGFTFENPLFLVLLPLLGVGLWWLRKSGRSNGVRLGVPMLGDFVKLPTWRNVAHRIGQVALAGCVVFAIISLARPQRQFVQRDEEAEGIDIMLVMDVSTSMLALDFTPDRLGASKVTAQTFAAARKFDRIGVVAFASEAYTLSPLTLDKQTVNLVLSELRTGRTGSDTAIGMGLASAVNGLKDAETASKVIILLTDGVNTAGVIDPRTAAGLAKEFGIRVYTIGVGTNGTAQVPTVLFNGRTALRQSRVQLDEQLLREMAEQTGGRYFRATDNTSLAQIYAEIDRLEKTPVKVSVSRRFDDLYAPFLYIALACLLLAGVIRVWLVPTIV